MRKADIDQNSKVNAFDLACAKRGLVKGFPDLAAEAAADIDESDDVSVADVIQLVQFLMEQKERFVIMTEEVTE